MSKRLPILFACIAALSFKSCQTDFSVNGNYQVTPVVMGIIDHNDSIHIIKITKAFLGDGNNLVYAKEPDSNYFQSIDCKVVEYDENGVATSNEWPLMDTSFSNKDTGVFYNPEQKAYYFKAANLQENYEYELTGTLYQSDTKDTTITARTTMIEGFKIASPAVLTSNQINFNGATVNSDDDYKAYKFTTQEGLNASRYNYKYVFKWREYYTDGTQQDFEMTRNNGDEKQESYLQANTHTAFFHGLDFFRWVGGYTNSGGTLVPGIIQYDADVDRRIVLGIDVRISIAHHNLDQFMDVTKPQTGIAQSQPEFTNVNGGLGLFSARHIFELENYRLSPNSMEELCTGQYTAGLQFCSIFPEDAGFSYACP